jgi:hypothetical protein
MIINNSQIDTSLQLNNPLINKRNVILNDQNKLLENLLGKILFKNIL